MTGPDLAELRRLAEAATPGPWYLDGPWWYGDDDSAYCISTAEDAGRIAVTIAPPRYIFGGEREVRDANARFIAAANPAVVLALLERDALAAKVERLTAGRDDTPRDDSAWATPGQAWAALLDAQPGERVEMLAGALRALEAEHSCIVEFHRGSAERLAAAAPVLSAAQAWRRAIARRDEARAHFHESEELWTAYIALCRDVTAKRDELRAALDEEPQP